MASLRQHACLKVWAMVELVAEMVQVRVRQEDVEVSSQVYATYIT